MLRTSRRRMQFNSFARCSAQPFARAHLPLGHSGPACTPRKLRRVLARSRAQTPTNRPGRGLLALAHGEHTRARLRAYRIAPAPSLLPASFFFSLRKLRARSFVIRAGLVPPSEARWPTLVKSARLPSARRNAVGRVPDQPNPPRSRRRRLGPVDERGRNVQRSMSDPRAPQFRQKLAVLILANYPALSNPARNGPSPAG